MTFVVERLAEIDIAAELSARRCDRFEYDTGAIRNLSRDAQFPPELVAELERRPGFRKVVIHEYVALDLDRAAEAMRRLAPVGRFVEIVRRIELEDPEG